MSRGTRQPRQLEQRPPLRNPARRGSNSRVLSWRGQGLRPLVTLWGIGSARGETHAILPSRGAWKGGPGSRLPPRLTILAFLPYPPARRRRADPRGR